MMKKAIALFLTFIMLLSVAACGKNSKTTDTNSKAPQKTNSANNDSSSDDSTSSDDLTSSDSSNEDSAFGNNVPSPKSPTAVTSTYTESENDVVQLQLDNSKVLNAKWNGVNAVDQGFIFLPDKYGRDYNDAQIAEELKRIDDMDVNMVRSYMDAGYAFVKREGRNITYDWDSERMRGFYKWMDAMGDRGVEVAVQMGWSVGSVAGSTTLDTAGYTIPWYLQGQVNRYEDIVAIYTDWVVNFVKEVIVKRGYPIKYCVMFTEPYHFNEYKVYENEEMVTKNGWEVSVELIKAADQALRKAGLRDLVKLTGPQYGLSQAFYECETLEDEIQWWIDRIDPYIDVYTFHWYAPTWPGVTRSSSASMYDDNYDLWLYYLGEMVKLISKTGKPFWFDEWNYGGQVMDTQKEDFYAQQVAQTVVAAMNTGVQNIIYWQLFETVWPQRFNSGGEFKEGIHVLGTAPSLYTSAVPYKLFYGFSLLAKYCGELGSKTYYGEGSNGVYCSMVEYQKDGKTYQNVLVVNTTSLEQKISLNFQKSIGKNMYRYLFDPVQTHPNTSAEMISADKGFTNVKTVLQDTIPAASIVIYSTVKD
ncbi:MAG: hypothetical protein IJT66_02505 [Clostridia bacterium]|nr:hypothetical protein [Clostridia bacterium]